MGMIERGSDPDLAGESIGAEHRSQLGPEHLDRDFAAMLQVLCQVHGRHPAPAELALDGVAAGESSAEAF